MHTVENKVAIINAFEESRARTIRKVARIVEVFKYIVHRIVNKNDSTPFIIIACNIYSLMLLVVIQFCSVSRDHAEIMKYKILRRA